MFPQSTVGYRPSSFGGPGGADPSRRRDPRPRVLARAAARSSILLLATLVLAGCGRGAGETFPPYDNSAEVDQYYRDNAEFYVFATPDDLPRDLVWEHGAELPELGSSKARRGGAYNGRIQDFPRTLRLYGPDSNSSFRPYLLDDVTVRLAHLHPNVPGGHQHFPGLLKEWAIDPASHTVYMRMDPAARWSDGVPVTADDVFFMFWFFQSTHIRAPWYNNWYGIGVNYSRVTRYDDHTFAITMRENRPDLPARVLQLYPVPRHFFKEVGPDFVERYNWRFPPTTGPYVITDAELQRLRTRRTGITLTRLNDWWANDKPNWRYRYNPDEIRLRVIRETPKAFEAFLAGELEAFGMNLAEYNYERLPDTHPLIQRGLVQKATFYNDVPRPTYGLWMNTARPHLDNRDVRLGIQYASNWQLVIEQYFRGEYIRMQTTADGYGDMSHPGIRARPFDIDRAMAHFAAAGFTRRGPDGILVNEAGERLSFDVTTGYEVLAPVLNILQQEARKAGLDFRVTVLDASAAWKKVQEKNHDITFSAFGVSVEQYPRYWETYHSANAYDVPFLEDGRTPNPERRIKTQTNNLESMAIPELDELIIRYDSSDSLDEMRVLAYRMEEILHEHASFVPGFIMPFYRIAYWRWIRWPDEFNVRFSRDASEFFLNWIDEDLRRATMAARRGDDRFEPSVEVYDQWKPH